jgi:hypothetical protein
MKTSIKTIGLLAALTMGLTSPLFSQVPDLTKDTQSVDRKLTYNLGATGLRGWIYTKAANNLDAAQGRTTLASRQILVTHVGAASPADGVMKLDDVILGVDGKPFGDDARKSIALAIQEAETEARGGVLKLTVWRAGQTQDLSLKLAVMGTYSDTAPWSCEKSKRILDSAIKVLEKETMEPNWAGSIQGLALLATGKPEYLPKLRDFAHGLARENTDPDKKPAGPTWGDTWQMSYRLLFLCEYFMVTRDEEILPSIEKRAVQLARGQSMYGTFGHGFAALTKDGNFNGSVPPYGPVNMAGLPANLAIVLARKCGVKHPEIDRAIIRAAGFFGYFTDKGAIPYGEHEPWPYHENNGKNSITAVMFAAIGNKPKDTEFFARMATAGFASREYGHTGQGFSYLWSALGAAAGGPDTAAAFFGKSSWHLDLVRRSDGSFTYDGGEQYGAGQTHDNTYYGNSSYNGLSPAATYVLTYALPLRKLVITGRDLDSSGWLNKADAAAGCLLQNWSPPSATGRRSSVAGRRRNWQRVPSPRRWCPNSSNSPTPAIRIRSRVPARPWGSSTLPGRCRLSSNSSLTRTVGCATRRPRLLEKWAEPPSRPLKASSRRSSRRRKPRGRSVGKTPCKSRTASWPLPSSPAPFGKSSTTWTPSCATRPSARYPPIPMAWPGPRSNTASRTNSARMMSSNSPRPFLPPWRVPVRRTPCSTM